MDSSEILPNLVQGSQPSYPDTRGFSVLVLCAREYQPSPNAFPGVHVFHVPLTDDPTTALSSDAWHAARMMGRTVAACIRGGRRTLVTCLAGQNRSGLVSAIAVWELTGWGGVACVRHVRARRPGSLHNERFCEALSTLPPDCAA